MNDYYDLGSYSRKISTTSAEAQTWFDRGLMWNYGYNFEEAVVCFEKVIEIDQTCVMGYWGIAYGIGCNYNKEWKVFSERDIGKVLKRSRDMIDLGRQHLNTATELEGALLTTLEKRFQASETLGEEELCAWNDDFADGMREVYQQFPDDWDVATLFAEALINRTPWQLWNLKTGQSAEGASTVEAIEVLERGIGQVEATGADPHPGLNHIYIHVMEMSPTPEKAWRAADILRDLVPDAGHLKHMPSHIDILCGDYYAAVVANNRAHEANNKFLAREGDLNEYTF
ncbi:MAG: tetratricopeptide repeat protein, partial [Anaerolineae bacterium]